MKLVALLFVFLFSAELQAASACKCNCDPFDRSLCAPWYDIERPCPSLCRGNPSLPVGRTACPTVKVLNIDKGIYEWRTLCNDQSDILTY
ncbi:MAG: hypothetical protein H0U57_07335 [Tatlockia sp.]|nr:hypothetical protein [Tatlockia sp.]